MCQPSTVLAGTTVKGAALDSVRLVSLGSASHCIGHCSCLCSLDRHGVSQPLWWRLRQVRTLLMSIFARSAWLRHPLCWWARRFMALLCPLFARSAWGQPATVLAVTTVEGADLELVPSFGVSSASHCGAGTTSEAASMKSVPFLCVVSASRCCGGHDK